VVIFAFGIIHPISFSCHPHKKRPAAFADDPRVTAISYPHTLPLLPTPSTPFAPRWQGKRPPLLDYPPLHRSL